MTSDDILNFVSALSQAGLAIAALWAVSTGTKQLRVWRTEAIDKQNAEAAKDLIIAARNASDVLKHIRSPHDRIPQEKLGDTNYLIENRWKRLRDHNVAFEKLREAATQADVLIGNPDIDRCVEVLFDTRIKWTTSLEMLQAEPEDLRTEPDRDEWIRHRRVVYGSYAKRDELGQAQLNAVRDLETILIPIAQMQERKR